MVTHTHLKPHHVSTLMKYLLNMNEGESHNHAKIEQILALQSSFPHEGLLYQMDIKS